MIAPAESAIALVTGADLAKPPDLGGRPGCGWTFRADPDAVIDALTRAGAPISVTSL